MSCLLEGECCINLASTKTEPVCGERGGFLEKWMIKWMIMEEKDFSPSLEDESLPLLKLAIKHPKVFMDRMEELESSIVDKDTTEKVLCRMFRWGLGAICYFLYEDDFNGQLPIPQTPIEEAAVTVTLHALEKASRFVPAESIMEYIPKRCAGCMMLNFVGFVAVWPSTEDKVKSILCNMAKNEITSTRELHAMAKTGRRHYKGRGMFAHGVSPPFPGVGYCTQFDDEFSREMTRCGEAVLERSTSMNFRLPSSSMSGFGEL
jgi:hypothetical protein